MLKGVTKIKRLLGLFFKVSALLLASLLILCFGYEKLMQAIYPVKYEEIVTAAAKEYELEPALIYSVIKTESNFDKDAVSHAQAQGLMQLIPDTFNFIKHHDEELSAHSISAIRDPIVNIYCGCSYLRYLIDKYGEVSTAVAAYNAGPGNIDKWLKNAQYSVDGITFYHIPFPETENYVKRVMNSKEMYIKLYFDKDK